MIAASTSASGVFPRSIALALTLCAGRGEAAVVHGCDSLYERIRPIVLKESAPAR